MSKDSLLASRRYTKEDKALVIGLANDVHKEDFYNFYISHTPKETQDHFNINGNVMRALRVFYDITEVSTKRGRSDNINRRHWHYYTDGVTEITVYDGEPIPYGFSLGRPPMSDGTKKKLSDSRKGGTAHNKGKVSITDGVTMKYVDSGLDIPEGYSRGNKNSGKVCYRDVNGCVRFFTECDVIPEGFTRGVGLQTERNKLSRKSRKDGNIEFCKENELVPMADLKTDYPNNWHRDREFLQTLNIVKHGGYKFVSIEDLPKIQNYKSHGRVQRRLDHIAKYERENNCVCLERLIEKYGQLNILTTLPSTSCYGSRFISNEYIKQIEEYYNFNSNKGYSHSEKDVLEYVKSIYSGKVLENVNDIIVNPETGRGLQIDIYIPEKKIGIEYDGVYWHSSQCGTSKNYHLNKSKLAESCGIHLIHIYSDEWEHKTDKIKQFLNILLGNIDAKVYARNCTVKKITNAEAKQFSEMTHLQGHRNASVTYGLFYGGVLAQLMSFSKTSNAKRNGAEWEIIRGCPGSNNIVIGGVSKLFTHFVRDYNPVSVFSYCDFNKFSGKSYENLGMEFIGYTGPDKYWVINGRLIPRSPTKYKELKEKSQGILWGSGSKKYIWHRKDGEEANAI